MHKAGTSMHKLVFTFQVSQGSVRLPVPASLNLNRFIPFFASDKRT